MERWRRLSSDDIGSRLFPDPVQFNEELSIQLKLLDYLGDRYWEAVRKYAS